MRLHCTSLRPGPATLARPSAGRPRLRSSANAGPCCRGQRRWSHPSATTGPACDNKAAVAYFQQRLAAFTVGYYQLLKQLAALTSHPTVLINLYYNPFDTHQHCLDSVGLTPAKQKSLTALLDALNNVLARGAQASGLIPVRQDFTGHALCDSRPYVQGLHDPAPFHPTPAGELAIALADEQALHQHTAPSPPPG